MLDVSVWTLLSPVHQGSTGGGEVEGKGVCLIAVQVAKMGKTSHPSSETTPFAPSLHPC